MAFVEESVEFSGAPPNGSVERGVERREHLSSDGETQTGDVPAYDAGDRRLLPAGPCRELSLRAASTPTKGATDSVHRELEPRQAR